MASHAGREFLNQDTSLNERDKRHQGPEPHEQRAEAKIVKTQNGERYSTNKSGRMAKIHLFC